MFPSLTIQFVHLYVGIQQKDIKTLSFRRLILVQLKTQAQ